MAQHLLKNNLWFFLVIFVTPTNSLPCCCRICCISERSTISPPPTTVSSIRPTVYPPSTIEYCDPEAEPLSESSQAIQGQRSGVSDFLKKLKPGKSGSPTAKSTSFKLTTKKSPTLKLTTKKLPTMKPTPRKLTATTKASRIPIRTSSSGNPPKATSTDKPKKILKKRILKAGSTGWNVFQTAVIGGQTVMRGIDLKNQVMERWKEMKDAKTTTTGPPTGGKVLMKRPVTTAKPEYEYYYVYEDEAEGKGKAVAGTKS